MKDFLEILGLYIMRMLYLEKQGYKLTVNECDYFDRVLGQFIDYIKYYGASVKNADVISEPVIANVSNLTIDLVPGADDIDKPVPIILVDKVYRALNEFRRSEVTYDVKIGFNDSVADKKSRLETIQGLVDALSLMRKYFSVNIKSEVIS